MLMLINCKIFHIVAIAFYFWKHLMKNEKDQDENISMFWTEKQVIDNHLCSCEHH